MMAFSFREFPNLLNKSKRLPEIAKSEAPLDAVSFLRQLPVWGPCMKELSLLAREWRDAAATRRACLLGEHLGHVLVLKLTIKATEGERSSVDLPEYDVERADDRRDVGKHVSAA